MELPRNVWLSLILASILIATPALSGEVDLDLPPVMQRKYGKVITSSGGWVKKVRFHGSRSKGSGTTRLVAPKSATKADIAQVLLADFWDGKFNDKTIPEFAPVNREVFLRHGTAMITGQPSNAPQLIHDWWNVRMGVPLPVSKTYHIAAINIYHDDGGSEVGHFCIGVRKIGGDADDDFVIDIRAPWYEDGAASFKQALNHDNSLINQLIPNNMYDWLYTQGEFRGCRSEIWFMRVSDAQVRLLQTILHRKNRIKTGPFRPLKGNCASIGEKILNRVLPLDHDFQLMYTIGDVPRPTAKQMVRRFGGDVAFVVLHSHQREGEPITAKSAIHPAEPSRSTTPEFKQLRSVPELN